MVPVFRMIFDISVYYTISGIYLQAFCQESPAFVGLLLLCVSMLLFGVLSVKFPSAKWRSTVFLLPLGLLLLKPGMAQLIQAIPAWSYSSVVLMTNRADVDYSVFCKRIFKAFGLLVLSLIPVLLALKPVFVYVGNVLVYFILALVSGVACLRNLRDRTGGLGHMAVVSLFATVCGLLVYFRIPQTILSFIHKGILFGLQQLEKLGDLLPIYLNPVEKKNVKADGSVVMETSQGFDVSAGDHSISEEVIKWVEVILSVAVTILAMILLIKLLTGIIKGLQKTENRQQLQHWDDEVVRIHSDGQEGKGAKKRKKPGNHRLTVRYYYWKYMQECRRRGIQIQKGWTAEDLSHAGVDQFRNTDLLAMQQLYVPLRYNENAKASAADAKEAARLWHEMKKTKPKT